MGGMMMGRRDSSATLGMTWETVLGDGASRFLGYARNDMGCVGGGMGWGTEQGWVWGVRPGWVVPGQRAILPQHLITLSVRTPQV